MAIGIILFTHHDLGEAYLDVLTHIYGQLPDRVKAMSIFPDEDIRSVELKFKNTMEQLGDIDELLLLTDLYGASPANFAVKISSQLIIKNELITGVNLSMLITAVSNTNLPLLQLAQKIVKNAKSGIILIPKHND